MRACSNRVSKCQTNRPPSRITTGASTTWPARLAGVARDVKITACADGIETADQLAAVKHLGFSCGQGYLLSPPVDVADMDRLVAAELAA
jgi:EAL domain-containing protein (putative c-di-GMP-specific phosphodiesterase class I)